MALIGKNEKGETTYKFSETFFSFQGEGTYTGKATAWVRFFSCNLQCNGFGQADPTDPSTYQLPYEDFDVSKIISVEELPVFEFGCDSSYTWSKKYRHLVHENTPDEIINRIAATVAHESNPNGLFQHPKTRQNCHMAFTGGEPMLNQPAMIDIMLAFEKANNVPLRVTVETNGTRKISPAMIDMLNRYQTTSEYGGMVEDSLGGVEWFWSCSPKLWSTAGESPKRAIKPEHLSQYAKASDHGHLKYVVNGTPGSWAEVEEHTAAFRAVGINWPVYIMPVGATKESQEEDQIATIAVEAMKRGYHFSGRLHASVFGNQVGT